MAIKQYLDFEGLSLFLKRIKGLFEQKLKSKVDKEEGKQLSSNDFTKEFIDQIEINKALRHTHTNKSDLDTITPERLSRWDEAQPNVLENIRVNKESLPIENKTVNIDLTPYAKLKDYTTTVRFRGVKTTYEDLLKQDLLTTAIGDLYLVSARCEIPGLGIFPKNTGFLYSGTSWIPFTGNEVPLDTELSNNSIWPVQNKVLKAALDSKLDDTQLSTPNGVAGLNEEGKLIEDQIPFSIKNIVEADSLQNFPKIGSKEKIYIAFDSNLTYRWDANTKTYIEISESLHLGETGTTAYRGDRGKVAYDHTFKTDNPHNVTKAQVGLGKVENQSNEERRVLSAKELENPQPIELTGHVTGKGIFDGKNPLGIEVTVVDDSHKHSTSTISDWPGIANILEKDNSSLATSGLVFNTTNQLDISLQDHKTDKNNPHEVTKLQVGLGNADNTSDKDKPISDATQLALNTKVNAVDMIEFTEMELREYFDGKKEETAV